MELLHQIGRAVRHALFRITEYFYEKRPVELQVKVTAFVRRCNSRPFKVCTAVAEAEALLPLRDADLLEIDQ